MRRALSDGWDFLVSGEVQASSDKLRSSYSVMSKSNRFQTNLLSFFRFKVRVLILFPDFFRDQASAGGPHNVDGVLHQACQMVLR